jgi:hypothetical protein
MFHLAPSPLRFNNLSLYVIPDGATPYVLFSNRHELRGVDLRTMSVKALISSLKNTIALDFYHTPDANMIFWTDVIDDNIYKGILMGGSELLYINKFSS